jgi:glutamate N-acetyltransferase/amino-acid N-acetyltransferase
MSVLAAGGFEAFGLASGIKESGAPDLALLATADRTAVSAAGVFTTNLATAAPVLVSRAHLVDGRAAAVIVNSGNANAATGQAGRRNALRMCELSARELGCAPDDVLVCSTGLIGIPMPMAPIETSVGRLAAGLTAGPEGATAAATAMLTTDTVRKESVATAGMGGSLTLTVGGMAKGAAMLQPAMATMLAVLTTDVAVDPRALRVALQRAVGESFNQLTVDGCMSTNDTVLVLASGALGNHPLGFGGRGYHALTDALTEVCGDLAEQMGRDAEGATKFARITVVGARTVDDARRAARGVANSQLVQCSLNGEDPYWGRILSELGASGAFIDPDRVDISYGGITVCRDGIEAEHDGRAVKAVMAEHDIDILCDLRVGQSEASIITTDLSFAYIDENAKTS